MNNAPSPETEPKWKRALWLALKIYAGFCTIIVTAYLALLVWVNLASQSPPGSEEIILKSEYGNYMATEYPRRGDNFSGLAVALGSRAKAVPVLRADVLKYLGKPDFISGSPDNGTMIYTYHRSEVSNRWEIIAFLKDGKLAEVGFSPEDANDHSGYKPYQEEQTPNPQGGANERQLIDSGTNRTPAAGASAR